MPSIVKLSSKNQIVVPRAARDALGLKAGDRLVVSVRDDGVVEMRRRPEDPGRDLEGILLAAGAHGDRQLWPEAECE